MTDTAGDKPPFPGFPGFPPAEMLDKMWDMMRMTPFGAAFPGMQPGTAQGFPSPLTAMSDMMSPLMSVEELDKRITDLRAVEQWLKLNLNMLQSAIQAMEVQRATLSTLRAFGAFAQASMTQPAQESGQAGSASPWGTPASWTASPAASASESSSAGARADESRGAAGATESEGATRRAEAADDATSPGAGETPGFDPSAWWNLLQSQFNQVAAFAMTQPGAGADGEAASASGPQKKGGAAGAAASSGKRAASPGSAPKPSAKPAAKRAPARKTAAKPEGGSGTDA
jgi:hypothetical protein